MPFEWFELFDFSKAKMMDVAGVGPLKSYEAIGQKGDVSTVCGEDVKFLGSFRISVPTSSELGDRPAAAGESMHLFSAFSWLVHGFTWCLHAPCT